MGFWWTREPVEHCVGNREEQKQEHSLTLMLRDPSTLNSSPRRADSSEVFPAPTGPTTANRQPWGTASVILATRNGTTVPGLAHAEAMPQMVVVTHMPSEYHLYFSGCLPTIAQGLL